MEDAPDTLAGLGYTDRWRALFAEHEAAGLAPARVIRADRGSVLVSTSTEIRRAEVSSKLRQEASGPEDFPAAGDWVALDAAPTHEVALIEAVLPRTSAVMRGTSGKTSDAQVLAANVDTVFIVHPIVDPNLRRIEREIALVWDSGAVPVVVLSKADLTEEAGDAVESVSAVALGVDVLVTSVVSEEGLPAAGDYARDGRTVALIGPSGSGKSSIVNALLGQEKQATREVRVSDGKGRHVTVTREIVPLPAGGALLDTPGLRAVTMVDAADGIAAAFPDIEELATGCRFRDCSHKGEPGCAVTAAVEDGGLAPERVESMHKLQREAEVAAMKTDARLRQQEVRKWKIIHKSAKDHHKRTGRDPRG